MNRPLASRRSGGFSLTEIIVVLAVIAILAAIIFAAMAPARVKARHTACMNNMRQQYIASMAYGADNDGETHSPELNGGAYSLTSWPLLQYGVTKEMMICPEAPEGSYEHLFLTTYAHAWVGLPDFPLGTRQDGPTHRDRLKEKFKEEGSSYLFIWCHVHDQIEHWPRNQDRKADPFLLGIQADGSVFQGLRKGHPRIFPLRGIPPKQNTRLVNPITGEPREQ